MSFGPESVLWRVDREAALLLGAGRALLLQIAHPLVAAGVRDHSGFARDPWGRLVRTLATTYAVVFEGPEVAAAALRRFEAVHRPVRGVLAHAEGPYPAGTPYDAGDPRLRLWVHATLVDTALVCFRRFVRPWRPGEAEAYYRDTCELARRFGIPVPLLPPTLDAFGAYLERALAREIAVGPTARALARQIFRPPGAPALGLVGALVRFVTAGLLPPAVRAQYGFRWSPARERVLEALARTLRATLPALPPLLRFVPPARAAARRRRRAAA